MEPIVFILHFRGQASHFGEKRNQVRINASAPSSTITTSIGEHGLDSRTNAIEGDMAFAESEFELTGTESFTGKESISFGDGPHVLELVASGPGRLESVADGNMTGTIGWRIQGGEGQFEAATGFLSSVFTMKSDGQFNEYQVGVLFLGG